ncbi:MAG: GerAB/ArcD/ProY family transporter [Chlamydiia bacterium]|nr:GerAB/ArcD/ProY family transporter [Chlamydiia bacterium]
MKQIAEVSQTRNLLGATLMVTGCCIGAGMIGLPALSALAGFVPALAAILLAYAFTTATGLLLLEATLWFDREVNLLSIAQFIFGKVGKIGVGLLFLFLFNGIFVAYLDAGGQIFGTLLHALFAQEFPREVGIFLCLICVALTIFTGIRGVDRTNRLLLIGLVLSYALIVGMGLSFVQMENLSYTSWKSALSILPILFISFGYQNLVPSLTYYLRKNIAHIRFAIVVGNLIPMLVYTLWNFVILGMIKEPEKVRVENGLVTELLQGLASGTVIPFLLNAFAFFAMFTSFITIAISLVDFFRDGLQGKKVPEWLVYTLAFLPSLVIALSIPNLFLRALSFAGGVVDVLLYGILPVCLVWVGRYHKQVRGPYQVGGNRLFLTAMFLASLAFLLLRVS